MCGIFCLVSFKGPIDIQAALRCMGYLNFRGPDKSNYKLYKLKDCEIFLGFTRLAIMDTTDKGLQPFETRIETGDATSAVVCNGEIYNFHQLIQTLQLKTQSQCDCEVILPIYKKCGFETMIHTHLDAEFAMVLIDLVNHKLYAARDKYGVRPLFLGQSADGQMYGFASEMKALHPIMFQIEPVKPTQTIELNLKMDPVMQFASCLVSSINTTEYPFKFANYNYKSTIPQLSIESILYKCIMDIDTIKYNIRCLFTQAVSKRLEADRPAVELVAPSGGSRDPFRPEVGRNRGPIGFLLSGGLDSSLVVAIATGILGPDKIVTFSIGLENSPDVIAAKKVVKFLGIEHNHHVVPFSIQAGIENIPNVIRATETYDITTIRASTPQYLMAKYISEKTDIKVILSGEGSDEIHGSYRYFRNAPSEEAFHQETIRLLSELYLFDNLRTDRTMAAHGLEVRVPFLDHAYVLYIMRIKPSHLMYNSNQMEKQIIRDAFKGYLPDEILYRSKEAFSDAVSSPEENWYKSIQLEAKKFETELNLATYEHNPPQTLDAKYFRKIFEEIYPGRSRVIPHYWLPKFQNVQVLDPSATVLGCY